MVKLHSHKNSSLGEVRSSNIKRVSRPIYYIQTSAWLHPILPSHNTLSLHHQFHFLKQPCISERPSHSSASALGLFHTWSPPTEAMTVPASLRASMCGTTHAEIPTSSRLSPWESIHTEVVTRKPPSSQPTDAVLLSAHGMLGGRMVVTVSSRRGRVWNSIARFMPTAPFRLRMRCACKCLHPNVATGVERGSYCYNRINSPSVWLLHGRMAVIREGYSVYTEDTQYHFLWCVEHLWIKTL